MKFIKSITKKKWSVMAVVCLVFLSTTVPNTSNVSAQNFGGVYNPAFSLPQESNQTNGANPASDPRVTIQGDTLIFTPNGGQPQSFPNYSFKESKDGEYLFYSGTQLYAFNQNGSNIPYKTDVGTKYGDGLGGQLEQFKDLVNKFNFDNIMDSIVRFFAELFLGFGSLILWIAGSLFDFILRLTIFDLTETIRAGGMESFINDAWEFFRDIANILFIFLILIAAIKIILNGNLFGQKKTLGTIIIVALLINFSLFFTKLVIDVSNIATTGIYNAFITESIGDPNVSLSAATVGHLGVQTFYGAGRETPTDILANKNKTDMLIVAIFGFMIMLVTAAVFVAASFLFAVRLFVFLLAMILSPLALVSMVVPKGGSFLKKWWGMLLSNAIFGPVFFILFYISLLFASRAFPVETGISFTEIRSDQAPDDGFMYLLFNYIMVVSFLFLTIFASKKVGAAGSGGAMSILSYGTRAVGSTSLGLAGRLGRNTIGRAGNALAESATVKNLQAGNALSRTFGGAFKGIGDTASKASFDARNAKGVAQLLKKTDLDLGKNKVGEKGYANIKKERIKEIQERSKTLGEKTFAEKDAEDVRNGAAFAKYIESVKTPQKQLDALKKLKSEGKTSVVINGERLNVDDGIRRNEKQIENLVKIRNEKTGDTEGKAFGKFVNDNSKDLEKVVEKYNKYNSAENSKYLAKQTALATKANARQTKFIERLQAPGFGQGFAEGLIKDKHGNAKNSLGLKTLHWAITGGNGGLRTTGRGFDREAVEAIKKAGGDEKKNKKQMEAIMKSAGLISEEDKPTPPPAPAPGPGPAPISPPGGSSSSGS